MIGKKKPKLTYFLIPLDWLYLDPPPKKRTRIYHPLHWFLNTPVSYNMIFDGMGQGRQAVGTQGAHILYISPLRNLEADLPRVNKDMGDIFPFSSICISVYSKNVHNGHY